jgi:hypothetical protein
MLSLQRGDQEKKNLKQLITDVNTYIHTNFAKKLINSDISYSTALKVANK